MTRFTTTFQLNRPIDPQALTAYLWDLSSRSNHVNAIEYKGHPPRTVLCESVSTWMVEGEAKFAVLGDTDHRWRESDFSVFDAKAAR